MIITHTKTSERISCIGQALTCVESVVPSLRVEYAELEKEYGILFIWSLFCEDSHLEYVRIHVIYRINQAEYVTHVHVAASQE